MCTITAFPIMLFFWLARAFWGARALAFLIAATCTSAFLVYGPFNNLSEIRFSLPACIFAIVAHELFYLRHFSKKQN